MRGYEDGGAGSGRTRGREARPPASGPVVSAMLAAISGAISGFLLAGHVTTAVAGLVFATAGFAAGFTGRGLLSGNDAEGP